jgi:hypothetical protein
VAIYSSETPYEYLEEHRVGEIVLGDSVKALEAAYHQSWWKPKTDVFEYGFLALFLTLKIRRTTYSGI